MTTATLCLFLACLAPIICTGGAKIVGSLKGPSGPLDNNNPRQWLAQHTGVAARLNAAQQNSWEALAIFAPAVLTAQAMAMPQDHVNLLAMVFIAARMAYVALYAADAATLRTLAWLVGFGASLALFFVR
jgi:uncharacterized MAPEG superfamily protein